MGSDVSSCPFHTVSQCGLIYASSSFAISMIMMMTVSHWGPIHGHNRTPSGKASISFTGHTTWHPAIERFGNMASSADDTTKEVKKRVITIISYALFVIIWNSSYCYCFRNHSELDLISMYVRIPRLIVVSMARLHWTRPTVGKNIWVMF